MNLNRGEDQSLEYLRTVAEKELEMVLATLPPDLGERARSIPVTYEPWPNAEMLKAGISTNTLGLFLGERFGDGVFRHRPLPSQIVLFLVVIWNVAGHSMSRYREQVRRTFLHELGHYLGLDEKEVRLRDL
ncbi:MAG: metallopeptidase family protein [Verrucomicrobia bacterium]|nr:metallopeptidase family protein [Verrucomicrobiota bacterium]